MLPKLVPFLLDSGNFQGMNTLSAVPHLGDVGDDDLKHLAVTWRAKALRGNREAYGVAHALEVEYRRRLRDSHIPQLHLEKVILGV
jgi:hypothetical protein